MTPEERLAANGTPLPAPPPPAASYDPIVRAGALCYVSGQLPTREGRLLAAGRVGSDVSREDAMLCAQQCALNVLAQLHAAVGELAAIRRLAKATVFVASDPSFIEQHRVAEGASQLFAEALGEAGRHARAAVGVAALPLGAPVEVDAIAEIAEQ